MKNRRGLVQQSSCAVTKTISANRRKVDSEANGPTSCWTIIRMQSSFRFVANRSFPQRTLFPFLILSQDCEIVLNRQRTVNNEDDVDMSEKDKVRCEKRERGDRPQK